MLRTPQFSLALLGASLAFPSAVLANPVLSGSPSTVFSGVTVSVVVSGIDVPLGETRRVFVFRSTSGMAPNATCAPGVDPVGAVTGCIDLVGPLLGNAHTDVATSGTATLSFRLSETLLTGPIGFQAIVVDPSNYAGDVASDVVVAHISEVLIDRYAQGLADGIASSKSRVLRRRRRLRRL
jgi:hypothetical protein